MHMHAPQKKPRMLAEPLPPCRLQDEKNQSAQASPAAAVNATSMQRADRHRGPVAASAKPAAMAGLMTSPGSQPDLPLEHRPSLILDHPDGVPSAGRRGPAASVPADERRSSGDKAMLLALAGPHGLPAISNKHVVSEQPTGDRPEAHCKHPSDVPAVDPAAAAGEKSMHDLVVSALTGAH